MSSGTFTTAERFDEVKHMLSGKPRASTTNVTLKVDKLGADNYVASCNEAGIHASGDTMEEAIANFKATLHSRFKTLSSLSDNQLGPVLLRQLAVMKQAVNWWPQEIERQ